MNLFQSKINDSTLKIIFGKLKDLKNLKILSLSFNNLINFNLLETLNSFKELIFLDISNNSINTINFSEKEVEKYKNINFNIEILDISFNFISDFNEISELIYLAYKSKLEGSDKTSEGIFTSLSYISFFGNPIPNKVFEYLSLKENLNLFNLNINLEKSLPNSNKKGKNSSDKTLKNYEKFYNNIKNILKKFDILKSDYINKNFEENLSNKIKLDEKLTEYNADDNCNSNNEVKEFNLNFDEIRKIDLNLNINENMDINSSKTRNFYVKNENVNNKGKINYSNTNFISINDLEKSQFIDKVIKYNLIENLKQFNVIYHNYSFKKVVSENDENKININTSNFLSKNYESGINQKIFENIFQEKVDKDKSSNVLLLSKQKLRIIPIISKIEENDNQVDLIYLYPNININGKIIYDSKCTSSIKIIYLNINKLTNLNYLDQFTDLEEIYLQNNKLKNLPSFVISNLRKLDISNNNLISLKGILHLKNLIYLNTENNYINNLNMQEFIELQELAEFNISGNNIYNLKECISLKNMKKIFNLDLSGNEVCNFNDFRITMIFYMPRLKILNRNTIDKNELATAKDYFEGRITNELLESIIGSDNSLNVKELDLSNNKLKDFDNIFNSNNFPNLKKLDLSRNIFSNFRIFGYMQNLEELYLNSNLFERMLTKKDKPIPNKGILGLPVIIIKKVKFLNNKIYICHYNFLFLIF